MRSKRLTIGIIGVVVIAAVGLALRAKSKAAGGAGPAGSAAEGRPVPVVISPVFRADVPVYLDGIGAVTPLQTVTLKSQVDGRLDRVLFKEGQYVRRGEVIAQVDPRPFTIQLHQAEASLERDRATLRNAKLNLERYQTLVKQNLIAQQQVDDQQTATDTAAASISADVAQIENAKLMLDYASLKSPLDGITGVRLVDPGNLIHAADATGIVIITQLDPIAVLFSLPQDDLGSVLKQMAAGPIAVDAFSRDGTQKLAAGQLALVDNQINQSTSTIRLKAIFPNPEKLLWPNAFVKARLLLSTIGGAVVVPAVAIQRGPKGSYVYVSMPDKTAAARPVEVQQIQGEQAIIAHGLEAGEQVVTDGQSQLRPGSRISPRTADRATPAGSASAKPADSAGGKPGSKP